MKKLIYMGIGLLLSLSAYLFIGCEKNKESESLNADEVIADLEASMVYVEGGTFMMGATPEQGDDAREDERPVHEVTLDGFYIGKYEITQAQWEAVMGTTEESKIFQFLERGIDIGINAENMDLLGLGNNYPMYFVFRKEAILFCEKLSEKTGKTYRLPTEAEWEYAARGGRKADGTKYAGSNDVDKVAQYGDRHFSRLVGQKNPNGLGLYDMSGNLMEMCSDWYGPYDSFSVTNPRGPEGGEYYVFRGGSWGQLADGCRVSWRSWGEDDVCDPGVGFRVVCER